LPDALACALQDRLSTAFQATGVGIGGDMDKAKTPRCAACESKACAQGKDCFDQAGNHPTLYQDARVAELHRAASAIEARHYCKEPRLSEVILFAKELGCRKVGLAFCIGLSEEAKVIERILSEHFDVVSVCCKVSGIGKRQFALEQIRPQGPEVMCNPAGQASLLNQAGTELNVLCGLCVGHDAIFGMVSTAPVTTLVVKDRVLAHNPLAAVYCRYVRRRLESHGNAPTDSKAESAQSPAQAARAPGLPRPGPAEGNNPRHHV